MRLGTLLGIVLCSLLLTAAAFAGGPAEKRKAELTASADPARAALTAQPVIAAAARPPEHRFFDRSNCLLFAGVFAGRAADMVTTWRFREHGDTEVLLSNSFVDNRPAFAAYSMGMAAANVGAAYALHRLGWHGAERALSVVHIGYMGALAVHNYELVQPGTK